VSIHPPSSEGLVLQPVSPPLPVAARMSERRTSLIAALLVAIGPVSMALYTPVMPELVRAFATSPASINATLTVYFAGFAIAQLIAGPLSDGFGRRRTTLWFMAIYLAGSLLAAFAPSVDILIAARLVQGIGAAVGITVARAIVRDQFTGDLAARIMNMVGIILAIAPAMSPALGGFTLGIAGWQAIFHLMVAFGLVSSLIVYLAMAETTVPARSHASPAGVFRAYRAVLADAEFLSASLVVGCAIGALYAQATILPFVLIDRVGLTPTQFGFGMIMQSGFFFLGSIVARLALRRMSADALVLPGLAFIAVGSAALIGALALLDLSFLSVMGPIAIAGFGIAFVMPHMTVAGLVPFPHIAGSASAMMGFIQMGAGLIGGAVAALIGDAVLALAIVVPGLAAIGIGSFVWYRAVLRARRSGMAV
jgi:MFS transporter, DHA1 family, multidrug resistance protein